MIAAAHAQAPGRARLRTAATAAVTLVAALAGVLVGGRLGADPATPAAAPPPSGPPPQMLHAGVASVPVPDGWSVGAPRFAVPGVRDSAGMWGASGDAVFAVLPPEDASLLPAALVRRAGGAPEPHPAPGDVGGWRYDFTSPGDGGRMSLVVMPATTGIVTLACLAPASGKGGGCVDAVRGVELRRGTFITPGPEAAVRIALPGALARLDRDRRAGRRELAAAETAGARVRATRSVARAYATAAALRPLAGEGRAAALVSLLGRLDADYRRLAVAHEQRYRRLAVRAGAAIGRREARLERQIVAISRSDGS